MLIAEKLELCLDVPGGGANGGARERSGKLKKCTVVTSRYFLKPIEELAKKHSIRAVAVDLNDFSQELAMLKELRPGSCVVL